MASSTPQPAAEFYEWALKRYQRRSVVLMRALVLMTIVLLLIVALFFVQVRDLRTQNELTRVGVERLQSQLLETRSVNAQRNESMAAYVRCLESRTDRYAEGLARLLQRKTTVQAFVRYYELKDCG